MKKFEKSVKVGDQIKYQKELYKIESIHNTRFWVKLQGLEGSFQRDHVLIVRSYT